MFDLQDFTFTQMIRVSADLRRIGNDAGSMEVAARRIVRYFYENLGSKQKGERACVLARVFKTHSFGELDQELREFATGMMRGHELSPAMKCLTLLATAGEKAEWNSRT